MPLDSPLRRVFGRCSLHLTGTKQPDGFRRPCALVAIAANGVAHLMPPQIHPRGYLQEGELDTPPEPGVLRKRIVKLWHCLGSARGGSALR